MTFSTDVQTEFLPGVYTSRVAVVNALRNIVYRGGKTATADALRFVRNNVFGGSGSTDGVRNVAIFITDGESNDRIATHMEARLTKTAGIHVISLGIGTLHLRFYIYNTMV